MSNGQVPPSQQDAGMAELQQAVGHLQQYLKGTMADHPKASLIAATAAGVVLGWTIKRR
jgi:hypothetical protein